jgi:arylsulfatase A-like enzyme/tetratricopeptide (TPR) repeat protein
LSIAALGFIACGRERAADPAAAPLPAPQPSILLVTLDTTRADSIGPDARVATPSFNNLAAQGRRFRQAYATVPETLPSHASMMTGLYPGGHGIHENARFVPAGHPVLAALLQKAGYRTAAFVSSFVLDRRFGLARGFERYDDEQPAGRSERTARETTDRAVAYLSEQLATPLFLWVHFFDPHAPYTPPQRFRREYAASPYLGEIAAMDEELGRLVRAFQERTRQAGQEAAIVVAGDHGEGLGDHGESQHGNLLYQATMHVPLLLVGPGVSAGVVDTPASTRRIFQTVLDWAGLGSSDSLRAPKAEVVLGEAMKPFLEFGWQPQVMAVEGRHKAILAGRVEIYDVVADPSETKDLAAGPGLPPAVSPALRDYPVPSPEAAVSATPMSAEERRKLASLGYVSAGAAPVVRKDAPRPADMTRLFDLIDRASGLFVAERYAEVIPLLVKILAADPDNLDATLRLAAAHSALRHEAQALDAFKRAAAIAPRSQDVRMYLALHYARGGQIDRAEPLLEQIIAESPERVPALEALADIRQRQKRLHEAVSLRQKLYALRRPSAAESVGLGQLAMAVGQTAVAIDAFEVARKGQGTEFRHDLELGVLYLSARRFSEARAALDRVPSSHPEYPMALFKRAQVSVLLNEADSNARIDQARKHADDTTRALIAKEKIFKK